MNDGREWFYRMCMMRANEASAWLREDEARYWMVRADAILNRGNEQRPKDA